MLKEKRRFMKKKNLLMTALATLSASGALLTTGASALADSYTVVKNDTLWGLSKKYGVSVSDLKKANGVSGHLIYVGQKLQIPTKSTKATKTAKISTSTSTVDTTSTTHTVVKGDTLWSLAKKYGVSVSTLMKANNLSSSTILIGQSLNLRAGMTTYGVNGVTTGSSSTAASTNTASSTSTTASSQRQRPRRLLRRRALLLTLAAIPTPALVPTLKASQLHLTAVRPLRPTLILQHQMLTLLQALTLQQAAVKQSARHQLLQPQLQLQLPQPVPARLLHTR
jgi:LysM repeat protein